MKWVSVAARESSKIFIIDGSTASAAIVKAPPAAIVASPETFVKIASSILENVIFFSVPASENKKWSP